MQFKTRTNIKQKPKQKQKPRKIKIYRKSVKEKCKPKLFTCNKEIYREQKINLISQNASTKYQQHVLERGENFYSFKAI